MKKLFPLFLFFLLISSISFPQLSDSTANQKKKLSQAILKNEIYCGYGAQSIFYYTGKMEHNYDLVFSTKFSNNQSAGTLIIGYARALSKVVSTGIMIGYQNIHNSGTGRLHESGKSVPLIIDDRLITGSARITFGYLNKPIIRLYSGIGVGLTMDFGRININGANTFERKWWIGGELTLIGLRVGRALGGFIELGAGSYGIVNAGLSYKFKD